jgi:hypothetical protein
MKCASCDDELCSESWYLHGAVSEHLGGDELEREVLVVGDAVPHDRRAPVKDVRAHLLAALRPQGFERPTTLLLLLLVHQHQRPLRVDRRFDLAKAVARGEVVL